MSVKSPGLGAGGLANLTNYATGTFTVTLTGVDTTVTGTATYTIIGNIVTLYIPLMSGNSNSTSKGVSGIPVAIRPAKSSQEIGTTLTDSAITSNVGRFRVNTDGTGTFAIVTPSTNALSGNFTNTGTFTVGSLTVTYPLT